MPCPLAAPLTPCGQNGAVRDGRTRLAPLAPTRGGERVAGAPAVSRSWSFWASSSWFYFVRRVSKHSAGVADNCAGGTFCLPVRAGASSVLRSCASALAPRLSSQGEVERVDVLEVLSWQSDHSFNANRRWGSQESRAGPGPAFAQARSPTRPHGLKGDPRCCPDTRRGLSRKYREDHLADLAGRDKTWL